MGKGYDMGSRYGLLPRDLAEVAVRVREDRPEPTALELDRIKLTAKARAGRPARETFQREEGSLMRSRFAITGMLALGVLLGSTGAALGVSGISGSGSAGTAQYAPQEGNQPLVPTPQAPSGQQPTQPPPNLVGEAPEVLSEEVPVENVAPVAGEEVPGGPGEEQPQTTRQAERGGGNELPFTGFAAIPLLLAGVALLGAGLTLRRRVGGAGVP